MTFEATSKISTQAWGFSALIAGICSVAETWLTLAICSIKGLSFGSKDYTKELKWSMWKERQVFIEKPDKF